MNDLSINLDSLEYLAKNADQGVWSIGQAGIETNRGLIECLTDAGLVHVPNALYLVNARPEVVLELIRLARLGKQHEANSYGVENQTGESNHE